MVILSIFEVLKIFIKMYKEKNIKKKFNNL